MPTRTLSAYSQDWDTVRSLGGGLASVGVRVVVDRYCQVPFAERAGPHTARGMKLGGEDVLRVNVSFLVHDLELMVAVGLGNASGGLRRMLATIRAAGMDKP